MISDRQIPIELLISAVAIAFLVVSIVALTNPRKRHFKLIAGLCLALAFGLVGVDDMLGVALTDHMTATGVVVSVKNYDEATSRTDFIVDSKGAKFHLHLNGRTDKLRVGEQVRVELALGSAEATRIDVLDGAEKGYRYQATAGGYREALGEGIGGLLIAAWTLRLWFKNPLPLPQRRRPPAHAL